jgi:protein-disulfide isomerase
MSWTRVVLGLLGVVCVVAVHAQDADKAAEVNGTPILAADVDAKLGNNLAQLQEQIFGLRQKQLGTMIDQKLLEDESAKRGVTIAALVQSEITSRVTPATSEEAQKFFDENSAKLQGDFDKLEAQIKTFLTAQRVQARQQEYLQSLRSAAKIDVFLARPPIFRSEVAVKGAPMRGNVGAPVTIVEFSDFHCPFCRKVQPVLDDLRAKYGAKIKIVYRDFPLDNLHPQARAAAEASHCAIEQGKFWEFHDQVFKNDPDSSQATLDRFAKESGMDVDAFEACNGSGKYKTLVQASGQEGTKLGITGTPTFFINGRILVGAQSVDVFARMIDEELAAPLQSGPQRAASSLTSEQTGLPQSGAQDDILGVATPPGLQAKIGGVTEARLKLELKSGFHVNSNMPSDQYLIPLQLTWNRGPLEPAEVIFPPPQLEKVSFWPQPLSLFNGTFDLITRFKTTPTAAPGPAMVTGKLRYQACNDRECLMPKDVGVAMQVEIVK